MKKTDLTVWEFIKTLKTKQRLNYIENTLRSQNKFPISMMKQSCALGGFFDWKESPQGIHYWISVLVY